MGCGCGKERRALGGITSNQTGQPLTPQEAAANAIANARGESYAGGGQSVAKSGDEDQV